MTTTQRDFDMAFNLATGANFSLHPPIVHGGIDNYPTSVSALVAAKFLKRACAVSSDGEDRNYTYFNISDLQIQIEGKWLNPGDSFEDAPYHTLW